MLGPGSSNPGGESQGPAGDGQTPVGNGKSWWELGSMYECLLPGPQLVDRDKDRRPRVRARMGRVAIGIRVGTGSPGIRSANKTEE